MCSVTTTKNIVIKDSGFDQINPLLVLKTERSIQITAKHIYISLLELRGRIYTADEQVTPEMLQRVWQEIDYGWDVCRIINASQIEHFQFKVK